MLIRKAGPTLMQITTKFLSAWCSQRTPHSILTFSRKYQSLISQQTRLGWGNMFHGIISKQQVIIQTKYYLYSIHFKISPHKWMAVFQRRIWCIAWLLWEDRNTILHTNHSIIEESTYINNTIITELRRSSDGLPRDCNHLFTIRPDQLLQKDTVTKQQWLYSVWSATDFHLSNIVHRDQENTFNNFLLHWRA